MRRLEAEAFSGAVIQSMHGEFDVLLGDFQEGHFLWEELADQAIHVLVGPALPGGIGVSKVEVGSEFAGNALVLCELPAVVGRQGMNAFSERRQQRDHRIRDCLRRLERHMSYQCVAGLAFVERDQSLLLAGADDQVGLPVTETLKRIHDSRTQINRYLVGDGAAPFATPVTFSSCFLAAQSTVEGAALALVCVDAVVDTLVAD